MKKLATQLMGVALLLTLGASLAAAANKYPPGPVYRSCPDSVTLFSVEREDTIAAPCHPATLDTVLGVRGIITGFDPRPVAFGFYIQNGTGPWTGVDVFTGSTNYLGSVPGTPTGGNLAVGDSVVIYGTTQEFPATNGTTEIEGPDVVQSTNDIIIRKINSGNPLRIHSSTVHELNWLPAFSQGEQWEGLIVKIPGPLKVGRVAGTGIQSPNYLLTTVAPSTDSVLVDAFTLTSAAPSAPAVGTIVDSIYGIVNQNTGATINSYRIQIRSGNDVFLAAPPNLADAYPIEDNQLRLVFDRNVDPITAQDASKYSLASAIDGSTVDSAVMETNPGNVVILNITSVRVDGDLETVSAGGIGSQSCPSCLISPTQSLSFINGVLTIAAVQAPDPANLSIFDDRSRWAGTGSPTSLPGTRLSVRGIQVKQFGSVYYLMDENGAQRGGIAQFAPLSPLVTSHRYLLAGAVQEFGNETELTNNSFLKDEGVGTIPAPNVQPVGVLRDTTTDMTQTNLTGEDFEGMLVKVSYVRVVEQRTVGLSFFVAGPNGTFADTILVSNLSGALDGYTPPDSASTVDVTGILHFTNGTFRICPRGPSDIVNHGLNVGVNDPKFASVMFSIAPNPARTSKISFSLPRKDNVSLGIYDLQGRQVAQLAKGSFNAGTYQREWSGLDASGNRARAGMYFYRLKVGNETQVLRGVLLQ